MEELFLQWFGQAPTISAFAWIYFHYKFRCDLTDLQIKEINLHIRNLEKKGKIR